MAEVSLHGTVCVCDGSVLRFSLPLFNQSHTFPLSQDSTAGVGMSSVRCTGTRTSTAAPSTTRQQAERSWRESTPRWSPKRSRNSDSFEFPFTRHICSFVEYMFLFVFGSDSHVVPCKSVWTVLLLPRQRPIGSWCGLNRTISHINNHLINILSLQINDEVACKDSSSW